MRRNTGIWLLSLGLFGCENTEVKLCHAEMQGAQKVLVDMDKDDPRSVQGALASIETTVTACRAAGRNEEVSTLADARRQVAAHLEALEKRVERPGRPTLSAEQLAELLKSGDPECPKGQGYEAQGTKQIVKCTGPQLVDLTATQARDHFDKRGYRLSPPGPDGAFTAEFGATRYAFRYAAPAAKPSCLEVTGRPGTPWQEMVARVTGVHPDRVRQGEPVRVGTRSLPLAISGDAAQWSVKLGACGG